MTKNRKKLFRLTMQKPDQTILRRAERRQKERDMRYMRDKLAKQLSDRQKAEEKHRRRVSAKRMDEFGKEAKAIREILQAQRQAEEKAEIWWAYGHPVWWPQNPQPQPVYTASGPDILEALLSREDG